MSTLTSNGIGDGSWNLTVAVSELNVERTLRVRGDLHVGGLMLQLVETLGVSQDWSDYALWWQSKSTWLLRTRSTLDQYGIQADSLLYFTPMHKNVHVLLPDLQVIDLKVNFSINVFSVVIRICKELGIRHPEELSLARHLSAEELRRNQGVSATRRTVRTPSTPGTSGVGASSPRYSSNSSLLFGTQGSTLQIHSPSRHTPSRAASRGSLLRTCSIPLSPYGSTLRSPYSPYNANGTLTPGSVNSLFFNGCATGPESPLANSPQMSTSDAFDLLYRPRNLVEKARINAGWFDSSRSLMEQGVVENSLILLKYKFYSFFDLNPKYDAVRINQIYEQAKWSILSEEVDCSLEEMIAFAALQIQIQSQNPHNEPLLNGRCSVNEADEDHIDAALDELQRALEGYGGNDVITSPSSSIANHSLRPRSDLMDVPQLADYLRYLKPKKGMWWRTYKKCYFVFRDTTLSMYRTSKTTGETPQWTLCLRGCEVFPDVSVSSSRYNVKVFITSSHGVVEIWLRPDTAEQYTKWMAAIKLACKGQTMADTRSYEAEMENINAFLAMQQSASRPGSSPAHVAPSSTLTLMSTTNQFNIQPQDYIAPKYVRKGRSKQLVQRILDAHNNVCNMSLNEAKLQYIRAWQQLPECGVSYFVVRCKQHKKDELLGVAFNRIMRLDVHSGDVIRTLHFEHMKSWSVNWDLKQVQVSFEEEDLMFQCFTADCKVVHEFIGGYIFLSMRSGDRSQTLNEELFHKLTGGWL